ncbi:alpha/beta hydrolase [Leeuwenhoekiella sp. H156]|uniref:alpha/beta hydrolase n=1 Tax=Leeuwenhoekiella sp. H156 TaxID=3450128 RepID=UPI003FA4C9C5
MKASLFIVLISYISLQNFSAQENRDLYLGTSYTLHSEILNENRIYSVNLPESYYEDKAENKTYPLLIVLDGNTHFRPLSGIVQYLSAASTRNLRIPEMIVIGIENVNRRRDFTPDKVITTRPNDTGGGAAFLSFLENELIPELDQKFRTNTNRILFGHSLGGLLAAHAYMQEESPFIGFIAVDPSFGTWDAETMDAKIEQVTPNSFQRFIYIATANWGKRNIRNRDRHIRWLESLNQKCEGPLPAKLEYFENETHSSVSVIAFYNGITTLFEEDGLYRKNIFLNPENQSPEQQN